MRGDLFGEPRVTLLIAAMFDIPGLFARGKALFGQIEQSDGSLLGKAVR